MNYSRRLILATSILALLPRSAHSDILSGYNFGPAVATPTLAPTTVGANVSATAITADAGLVLDLTSPAVQPASAPYLRTTFTVVSANQSVAFTNNADFQFTLNADAGYKLDLSSLTFNAMRGGAGTPRGYAVRSSVDSFASVLSTADIPTARPTFTPYSVDLTGAAFQNLGTITFKIYSYSPGTGSSVEYDDFLLNGFASLLAFTGYSWVGGVDGNWNTTTANWSGPGTSYVEGGNARFGDSATTGINVAAGGVNPGLMLVETDTSNYTFSGGGIVVGSSLKKTGASTATILNAVSAPLTQVTGGVLAVGSGGSLTSPAVSVGVPGTLTVANGASFGSTTTLTANGIVTFDNAAQTLAALTGSGNVTLNGTTLNVSGASSFDGSLGGTGSLVKNTPGTLTLTSNTTTFSGGSSVSAGVLQLSGTNAGGTGVVTVATGGTLLLGGAVATPITLNGGTLGVSAAINAPATLKVTAPSVVNNFNSATGATPNNFIVSGMLQGSGNISFVGINNNAPDAAPGFRLNGPVSSGPDTYTGTISVSQGVKFELQTSVASGSPMGTGKLLLSAGTTATDATGSYSDTLLRNISTGSTVLGNDIEIVGAGAAYLNLVGTAPVGSVVGLGNLRIGNAQTLGAVATSGGPYTAAFSSVTLGGGTSTFVPAPVANTSFIGSRNIELGTITQTAPAGIVVNGVGAVTLTGANTYTGPTEVQAGTLAIGPAGSIATSSAINLTGAGTKLNVAAIAGGLVIPAGQTLSGIGDWDGTIRLGGGNLAPGNSIGTLSGDDLILDGGSALTFELSSIDNTGDLLTLSGGFTKGAPGSFLFDFEGGGAQNQTYTLVNFLSSDFLAGDFGYTDLRPGLTGSFQMAANNLQFTVVPEPSAAIAILGGLGILGLRRRRGTR